MRYLVIICLSLMAIHAPALKSIDGTPGSLGNLAFVQDGYLWVNALPNGMPQRAAPGAAGSPRWSPSGSWLLTGQTVLAADGSSERDAKGCVAWSPIVDEMVCIEQNQGLAVESAGGSVRQTIDLGQTPRDPRWNPAGTKIAYTVDGALDTSSTPYQRTSSLWVVNRDGTGALDVYDSQGYEAGGGQVRLVDWSWDGAEIVFALDTAFSASLAADGLALYSVPADGGVASSLNVTTLLFNEFFGGFSSSNTMAFTAGAGRETWTNKRIATVEPASGTLTYLTGPEVAAISPAWSPSGAAIAYVSAPDVGNVSSNEALAGIAQRRIWIMDADGSNKRQVTDDAAYRDERPLWSRDGSQILFTRIDSSGTASLWLVGAEGGLPAKVADISFPGPGPLGFGVFGYVPWDQSFDWWQAQGRLG